MLILIEPDAVHEYRIGEATFLYREAPCDAVAELKREHSDRLGRLDQVPYRKALLLAYVVGWSGVGDANGVEVEFSPEVAADTLSRIPEHVAQSLDMRIHALYREAQDSGKDSPTDSDG